MTYRPFSHSCSFPVPNFGTFKKMHEKTSGKTVFPEVPINYILFIHNNGAYQLLYYLIIQKPPKFPPPLQEAPLLS